MDSFKSEAGVQRPPYNGLDGEQTVTLRRAVGKLVHFGEQVGVTPEQMILLLDSGMSVRGLLYYLVAQESRVKCRLGKQIRAC